MGNVVGNFLQRQGHRPPPLLAQEIDHKGAPNRPVDCRIDVGERSLVFAKDDIFDPMQGIFNSPMVANAMGKAFSTGDEGTNKPTTLMIGLGLASSHLVDTDGSTHTCPLLWHLMGTVIDPHSALNLSVTRAFLSLPSTLRVVFESQSQQLVQQSLLIGFERNQKVVATVQDCGDGFF